MGELKKGGGLQLSAKLAVLLFRRFKSRGIQCPGPGPTPGPQFVRSRAAGEMGVREAPFAQVTGKAAHTPTKLRSLGCKAPVGAKSFARQHKHPTHTQTLARSSICMGGAQRTRHSHRWSWVHVPAARTRKHTRPGPARQAAKTGDHWFTALVVKKCFFKTSGKTSRRILLGFLAAMSCDGG